MKTGVPLSSAFALVLIGLLVPRLLLATSDWVYDFAAEPGTSNNIKFGWSVAVSSSGTYLVVGSPYETINSMGQIGTLRAYSQGADSWELMATLNIESPTEYCNFGTSVVMLNDRIIGGAPGDNNNAGAIMAFSLSGTNWIAQAKIVGTVGSRLGASVATDGILLVVGAESDQSNTGLLVVYTINGSGMWEQFMTLSGSTVINSLMGRSVSLNSKVILAGAEGESSHKGCGYVWARNGNAITATAQRLTTSTPLSGAVDMGHSSTVISNTMAALGCFSGNIIYFFTLSGSTWSQSSTLAAPSELSLQFFGTLLAYSAPYLLVGAQGKALMFTLSGNAFSTTYLDLVPTAEVSSNNGFNSVSLNGNYAAVGDYFIGEDRRTLSFAQSVYTFHVPPPAVVQTVVASSNSKSKTVGFKVAFWNDMALISIPFCFDASVSCDGGYINVYKKGTSTAEWKFGTMVRNPFRNRDNKFGYNMIVNDYYLIVSAPDSNYIDKDIGIVVLYTWSTDLKKFIKNSIIRYRKTNKDYDLGSALSNIDTVTSIGMPEYDESSTLTHSGCTHIFTKKDDGKWGKRSAITTPTPVKDEHFGKSVSMQSKTRVAISNDPSDESLQAVYIFDFANDAWSFAQKVFDTNKVGFGWKIKFISDLLYISAIHDTTVQEDGGSISVYEADAQGRYKPSYVFQASTVVAKENFGFSFSTDGTRLVVGAKPCDDGNTCSTRGAAYTFTKNSSNKWAQKDRFALGAADGSDGFGYDVAINGETVLVSAPYDSTSPRNGVAYFITK